MLEGDVSVCEIKASRTDGFSSTFIKKFWLTLHDDIASYVQDFFLPLG